MELIGIDYGHKRIGLSHADSSLGLAFALPALTQKTQEERLKALATAIQSYRPSQLVVGYPYHMDGRVSQKAQEVDAFIVLLEKTFALPVVRIDERQTSLDAQSALETQRKKPRSLKEAQAQRASGDLDSQAARILLQDFLDSSQNA